MSNHLLDASRKAAQRFNNLNHTWRAFRTRACAVPCLFSVLICLSSASQLHGETWTSLTGNRSVQAKMVGMWDEQVVLLLADGRRVSVPMDSLVAESRIQAKKIATTLDSQRQTLRNELTNVAQIEAAPAPDPLPMPPDTSTYTKPPADQSPSDFVETIQKQIQAGHLIVLYDSLPPSYRDQLDGLVALAMKKLEPTSLNDAMTQLHSVADLIVTRQNWIRSYPRLSDGGESSRLNQTGEIVDKLIIPVASLVRAGLPSDRANVQTLRSTAFGDWLRERDQTIAPHLAVLLQEFSRRGQTWSTGDVKDDTTTIESILPTPAPTNASSSSQQTAASTLTIALKKVEGYWIPADVASGFGDWVKQQTDALDKFEDGSMSLSQWLGGESISVASASVNNTGAARGPGSEYDGGMSGYEEEMAFESENMDAMSGMESMEGMEGMEGMDAMEGMDGMGGGYSNTRRAAAMRPPSITPEMIGTFLQTIGMTQPLIAPLESAGDAAAFHQAIERTVAPIESVLKLMR